jgi:hypothetical protein
MVSKAAGIIGSLPGFNRYTRNPGDFVGLRMSERAGPSADAVRLRQMGWAAETAKTPPPRALRYNAQCCSLFRTQPTTLIGGSVVIRSKLWTKWATREEPPDGRFPGPFDRATA